MKPHDATNPLAREAKLKSKKLGDILSKPLDSNPEGGLKPFKMVPRRLVDDALGSIYNKPN